MSFPILILALSCVGLAAVFSAVGLWRRDVGPARSLTSPHLLGLLCLLLGGAALVAAGHYRLWRWSPMQGEGLDALSWRWAALLTACVVLVVAGAVLRVAGRRGDDPRAAAWSVALALIITLTELSAFQMRDDRVIRAVPRVELDVAGVNAPAVSTSRYEFDQDRDWVSRVGATWMKALEPYKGKPNVRYLEVGVYEGRSFIWMAENILTHPTSRLTGIDPFIDPQLQKARTEELQGCLLREREGRGPRGPNRGARGLLANRDAQTAARLV